jgi:hypothetical protein
MQSSTLLLVCFVFLSFSLSYAQIPKCVSGSSCSDCLNAGVCNISPSSFFLLCFFFFFVSSFFVSYFFFHLSSSLFFVLVLYFFVLYFFVLYFFVLYFFVILFFYSSQFVLHNLCFILRSLFDHCCDPVNTVLTHIFHSAIIVIME